MNCCHQVLRRPVFAFIVAALCSASAGAVAGADSLPVDGPHGFNSADQTIVDVTIAHSVEPNRALELHVPRSAITFVADYPSDQYPVLPEKFVTKETFRLGLAAPDGAPLGEAVERQSRTGGKSLWSAVNELRRNRIMIDVWVVGSRAKAGTQIFSHYYTPRLPGAEMTELPSLDGLKVLEERLYKKNPDGSLDRNSYTLVTNDLIFLPADESDLFDLAVCPNDSKSPLFFCDYFKRLNDLTSLRLRFVDLRYNGGRKFANAYMRIALRRFCEFDNECGWSDQ